MTCCSHLPLGVIAVKFITRIKVLKLAKESLRTTNITYGDDVEIIA